MLLEELSQHQHTQFAGKGQQNKNERTQKNRWSQQKIGSPLPNRMAIVTVPGRKEEEKQRRAAFAWSNLHFPCL